MKTFTLKKIYQAYFDCRRCKRNTINALRFELDLENNINRLYEDLGAGRYQPGRSICFIVTEPKPREIFAADFRDRIVHHLLVNELVEKAEKIFIYDSYACRKGKGTHRAVARLAKFAAICGRKTEEAWFMKLDISNFFMSIDKNILYRLVLDLIDKHDKDCDWKNDVAELAGLIIFHEPIGNYYRKGDSGLNKLVPAHKSLFGQPAGKGLPIGNYSSQFFANLYMNKIDHYIKRELKCRRYIRYVDDIVMLGPNNTLKKWRDLVRTEIKSSLKLDLSDKKTVIQTLDKGVDFLGYFVMQNRIYPRRNVKSRYKDKLFNAAIGARSIGWRKLLSIAASYRGHIGYFGQSL